MADPTIALAIPGLILQGDPGAQRNRDQVYKAVKAIIFNDTGLAYQVPNVELTTGTVITPAEVTFPMRNPDLDEGEGHWFVSGEKLTVEVDLEVLAVPTTATSKLYVGLYFDPSSSTTLANAQAGDLVTPVQFQVQTSTVVGTVYRYRWTLTAMGPQEQWAELERAEALDPATGLSIGNASTIPRIRRRAVDFSGTTQRSLAVYTNVQVTAAGDLTVTDVRLRRVTAYIEGISGQNE